MYQQIKINVVEPKETIHGLAPLFCLGNYVKCLKLIEKVGRVAYKSEWMITEDSWMDFSFKMAKMRHFSVLEFSNMCLKVKFIEDSVIIDFLLKSKFFTIVPNIGDGLEYFISGSIRSWMELLNCFEIDLIFRELNRYFEGKAEFEILENNEDIPKECRRFLIHFVHNRAFTHELIRHRPCSFLQESQRYVKYDKAFEIIRPYWVGEEDIQLFINRYLNEEFMGYCESKLYNFVFGICESCKSYYDLRVEGTHQQNARDVLPNATKTEIYVMTNNIEWRHIYNLRSGSGAQPDMKRSMKNLIDDASFKNFIGE